MVVGASVRPRVALGAFAIRGLLRAWANLRAGRALWSVKRDCSLFLCLFDGLLDGALLLASELLRNEGTHGVGALLAVDHDGEALVVVQLGASVTGSLFLGGDGLVPLLLETLGLPGLHDVAGAGATLNTELELGESETAERVEHAGHVGTNHQHSLVIAPVNDHDQLAVVLAKVNISDSASLNVSSNGLKGSQ